MDVVTGAFGYIGRYITDRLFKTGRQVKTITTHPNKPNPFGDRIQVYPYHFDQPELLKAVLSGVDTLYNTYWVRFNHRSMTFEKALENTRVLFQCAYESGVKKIVHISVTNPSLDSNLPYYRGKARQEELVKSCGVSHAVIRPTLVFGKEDILVNNIAWLIRKFPMFPIFGDGSYRVQPVYVGDLAEIAVESAHQSHSFAVDAIGPEEFTFEDFVRLISTEISRQVRFLKVSPAVGIFAGKMIGYYLRDVILTRDELEGLMMNLLTSKQSPNGSTKFSEWLAENRETIGTKYSSELQRHFRWKPG